VEALDCSGDQGTIAPSHSLLLRRLATAWIVVTCCSCAAPAAIQPLQEAVTRMSAHDQAGDWTEPLCAQMAQTFRSLAHDPSAAVAHYHAGLVWQRCDKHEEARSAMKAALSADPSMVAAKAALAVYGWEEQPGAASLDQAIETLAMANGPAAAPEPDLLADFARLLLLRGREGSGLWCGSDGQCAVLALQRALRVEPDHAPSHNQLAIYLSTRALAGGDGSMGRRQTLLLARLVCETASARHPSYAPIRNTAGIVELQLGNIAAAAELFQRAREIDPKMLDAHLNYGATLLSVRNFEQAAEAFRAAAALRVGSYDAWLGLGTAARGQITSRNEAAMIAFAQECLERSVRLAPDRPEAWFEQAMLMSRLPSGWGGQPRAQIERLRSALRLFDAFLQRAGNLPQFAADAAQAGEHKREIQALLGFLETPQN
jgi:tetratricopeptide (TPR) repeat protein